ncbi:MAG: hypothetical protein GY711_13270 [bacterium]|nr:hypothetical protein [bacterium]
MIPHSRTLVERLQSEPFALIGVNTDSDKETYRKGVEEHQVAWRSSWQGGTGGPLTKEWSVQSYPTVFLIDHKGVIRERWQGDPGGEALDAAVDKYVALAKRDLEK